MKRSEARMVRQTCGYLLTHSLRYSKEAKEEKERDFTEWTDETEEKPAGHERGQIYGCSRPPALTLPKKDLLAGSSSSLTGLWSSVGTRAMEGFRAMGGGRGLFPTTASLLMVLLDWDSLRVESLRICVRTWQTVEPTVIRLLQFELKLLWNVQKIIFTQTHHCLGSVYAAFTILRSFSQRCGGDVRKHGVHMCVIEQIIFDFLQRIQKKLSNTTL